MTKRIEFKNYSIDISIQHAKSSKLVGQSSNMSVLQWFASLEFPVSEKNKLDWDSLIKDRNTVTTFKTTIWPMLLRCQGSPEFNTWVSKIDKIIERLNPFQGDILNEIMEQLFPDFTDGGILPEMKKCLTQST